MKEHPPPEDIMQGQDNPGGGKVGGVEKEIKPGDAINYMIHDANVTIAVVI